MNEAVIRMSKDTLRMSSVKIFRMKSLKAITLSSEFYSEELAGPCTTRYGFQMCTKLIHKANSYTQATTQVQVL